VKSQPFKVARSYYFILPKTALGCYS